MTSVEWCASRKAGIEALELNDTQVLVDLSLDKKPQHTNKYKKSNAMLMEALKGSKYVL